MSGLHAPICGQSLGQRLQNAFEHVLEFGNADAVIGYRHAGSFAFVDTGQYLAPVVHAAAALDNQPIFGQIGREVAAGNMVYQQIGFRLFPQPARNFYPADIVFHRMVRAGLRNQNFVAVFKF